MSILSLIILVVFVIYFLSGLRIIKQYKRGIVFTLRKFSHVKYPGLTFIWPIFQTLEIVDIRVQTIDIPRQEAITKDNVPVGINAVLYFQVEQPDKAILEVSDYYYAVANYAQAALRDTIGQVDLDTLLSEREKVANTIKSVVDEATNPWGINVTAVKIQDIELPAEMRRAMAQQAEAERAKRAVIIKAEGEKIAAENLSQAASVLAQVSGGLTIRTLQTIEKINPDPSKTVIFLLPTELQGILERFSKKE
ncbi:MAG: membrane protein [Candidatus Parcubacteria bacterium]|nr:MAG: membrane protein [Candidatus Parcubacteria bacterium]